MVLHQSEPLKRICVGRYMFQKQVSLPSKDSAYSQLLVRPYARMNSIFPEITRQRAVQGPTCVTLSSERPVLVFRASYYLSRTVASF